MQTDQDSYQPNHSPSQLNFLSKQIDTKHVPESLSHPVSRLLNNPTNTTAVVTSNNSPNPLENFTNKSNQTNSHVSKPLMLSPNLPTSNTDQVGISQHLSLPVPNPLISIPTNLSTPSLIEVVENWLKTAKNDLQNSTKENMKEKNETPKYHSNNNINGPKLVRAKKLRLNQFSANGHKQQNGDYNHNYEINKISGCRLTTSRPNSPRGYSRRRADSQSSSRPQSRHASPRHDQRKAPSNQEYLNPQRYWESDKTILQNQKSNYQFQNSSNHPYRNHMSYHQQNQEKRNEQNYQQKPNHIQETSRRLTTIETDGTSYQMLATSIEHDGEEVYTKSVEEIKEDKLNQLRNNGVEGNLEGSKRPNQLKMFITRVAPQTSVADMEYYILENFPEVIHAYIRKTPMFKNKYYASFVVIARADSDTNLDLDDFQSHNWPDDIRVFPGREHGEQQGI